MILPLKQLLDCCQVETLAGDHGVMITSVVSDSRQVIAGSLFVAVSGTAVDGHQFIADAWRRGAAAVLVDSPTVFVTQHSALPAGRALCLVADSRKSLALLAACWHGFPAQKLHLIGITGTNGKTTVSYLLEHLLQGAGFQVGVVGTVSYRFSGTERVADRTTPGPEQLQQLLRQMVDAGVTCCIMEVSSHALIQERVYGLPFAEVVFTNLTHEHLDYHRDMEDYFQAKKRLFADEHRQAVKIINSDDPWGCRLLAEVAEPKESYGLIDHPDLLAAELRLTSQGAHFVLSTAGEALAFQSPLIGRFNVANVLAAVAAARRLGCGVAELQQGVASFSSVPGRLERVPNQRRIHVFVDYAHTPDALEGVLSTLKETVSGGRLLTLFGCGGNRDRQKRPAMGAIAQRYSDLVVVTSDNPRHEDPEVIIADILSGMEQSPAVIVEVDRRRAISRIIAASCPGDLVLLAGKGHETYQQVGARQLPFDDVAVAREVMAA
ncbi:MAG: UDP-N-acetylmuramoyl-L-alanyl-D-glutamate--2,6-diaminopimelate ligase [Deltaproteobacteria bacterium]|nr:UDP-N-acetylmuramoyl-L-alanyl-D-glutamate--2,6-diaminopimelate ligase [Candidatus Anaeroferrophillus wilburensis]MBN2888984.1 UDP-N-acetylmuramoyl-L-alanyl-D-glutamate--2,6-diaminopimelate ligase [Deltaproteobacteria bacterium]